MLRVAAWSPASARRRLTGPVEAVGSFEEAVARSGRNKAALEYGGRLQGDQPTRDPATRPRWASGDLQLFVPHASQALRSDAAEASLDCHALMVMVEMWAQGRDHPVLLGVPETSYMKCAVFCRRE